MIIIPSNCASAIPSDPSWPYVSLLVKDIGINGATNNSFRDDGPYNFLPTRNGDVTQGSFSPFGELVGSADPLASYGSAYFNGTSWFTTSANSSLALGTGNFTVEFWYYLSANLTSGNMYLLTTETSATNGNSGGLLIMLQGSNNRILAGSWTGTSILASGVGLTGGVWNHLALVRNSGTMTLYVNGVSAGTASDTADLSNSQFCFGAYGETYGTSVGGLFKGYISNVRIVKGTAVYTGNFTVPSSPLTAVSGTVLLTATKSTGAVPVDQSSGNVPMQNYGAGPHWMTPFKTGYGSVYFDGSGDYLTVPKTTAHDFGTSDFAIEAWIYPTASATGSIVAAYNATDGNGWFFRFNNTNALAFWHTNVNLITSTQTVSLNTWSHVAVCRSGTALKMYLNGIEIGSTTNSTSIDSTSSSVFIGSLAVTTQPFNGYISNVRVVKGSPVYTSAFTPPTAPLTAITGTSLLTCQDKGSIVDASTNSFTVTRVGDAKPVGMTPFAQKQAGYWSNYFDGSGDYLTLPTSSTLSLGTGDFTIEFWINTDTNIWASGNTYLFDGGINLTRIQVYNGVIYFIPYGDVSYATGNCSSMTANRWYHIAMVRSGTSLKGYVDGVAVASSSNASNLQDTTFNIGSYGGGGGAVKGYISNFRIVKGTAVYAGNFTPPVAPLTAISGTVLLTCQDNRIRDNGPNNFAVTKYGDTAVSRSNPFGPSLPAPTVNVASAGSVYFDGSGDYLQVDSNLTAFSLPGDFTIEFWICPTGTQTDFGGIVMHRDTAGWSAGDHWGIRTHTAAGKVGFAYAGDGSTYVDMGTYETGSWTHHAITRSGSTLTTFKNGLQVATATAAPGTYSWSANVPIVIGRNYISGLYYSGYISNVRIVKGSAVYTAPFTPSTSPLTAISGTSLLTAQDAVTVTDASSNNFTVTKVGDAKAVEASPFKRVTYPYGGSAYFDGSGDNLAVPGANLGFGTADFTVEFWFNQSVSVGYACFWSTVASYPSAGLRLITNGYGTGLMLGGTGTENVFPPGTETGSPLFANGVWNHVAVVRNGSVLTVYLNGQSVGSVSGFTRSVGTDTFTIGQVSNSYYYNGYMSNFRVTKAAVYTANFTPPVAPVSAVGGTSLLLNFDNAGIYDGSGNGDLAVTGNTKVSTTAAKYGSTSVAFDSTGYLASTPSISAFGTGEFTIEMWVYPNTVSGVQGLIDFRSSNTAPCIFMNGTTLCYDIGSTVISGGTMAANAWQHVAVCRSGTSTKLFLNGTQVGSTYSDSNNYAVGASRPRIGSTQINESFNGYVDDVRVTKTARYTSTFTPPAIEAATQKG